MQALDTFRHVRPQIAAADLAKYDEAVTSASHAFTCCSAATALADSWAGIFGEKDPCVRGLRAILPRAQK